MKYTLHIDSERDEEVIVYAHAKGKLTDELERLVNASKIDTPTILGYKNDEIIKLDTEEIYFFFIENKRLYASTTKGDLLIKRRLYEIESICPDFIRINQSTLANKNQIERFSVSIGASLCVHFKNGRRDYVSRRQLKSVKERLGIK